MSPEKIIEFHKTLAPSHGVFELVYTHCRIVRDIAVQLIEKRNLIVDRDLVEAGALLHDISTYVLFASDGRLLDGVSYITHGTEGERILKEAGFPETLWRIASHHTGVGITKQDVIDQQLPLELKDYLAETTEERLIMYADKFHSKTTPPFFNSFAWYSQDVARFGEDKATAFQQLADEFGLPDLTSLSKQYGYSIR